MAPPLTVEKREGVWIARMHAPPRGLMSPALLSALTELTVRAERAGGPRAVVITGAAEDAFVTHFDVARLAVSARRAPPLGPRAAYAVVRLARLARGVRAGRALAGSARTEGLVQLLDLGDLVLRMGRSPVVYVAAVNGLALGAGALLALACDVRLVADRPDAALGLPEILIGLLPVGIIGTLTRQVGSARALELLLEGRTLAPAEAVALGLATGVEAPEDLVAQATAVATRLGRRSPASVAAIKRSVSGTDRPAARRRSDREAAGFLVALGTAPARRATRELARRHPSEVPLASAAYLDALAPWWRGEAVELDG